MILNFIQGVGWVALGCFSLHYLWLLGVWAWCSRREVPVPRRFHRLPSVTVQLPVYNERYVVERLLAAVVRLDYPRDLLEIQVLDDSTDDTSDLIAQKVAALRAVGHDIVHVRRTHRLGYKAGALADGLVSASGEFLALFDADFVPPANFLQRTIHHFTDPAVGMVQTRWGHLNRTQSLLTRAQAMMMDGHFLIEQVARSRGGFFFNFNGSAGIWRRSAIVTAGGWQSDTLAEDLDLSYRAQLAGWKFVYRKDVVVPAELPVDMPSFKAQYRRWAQGSIQAALKLLPEILRSRQPWPVKLEACFHFGNWFHYPFGMVAALLILPQLMTSRSLLTTHAASLWGGCMSLLLLAATAVFHAAAQKQIGRLRWRFLWELPLLMSVSVGLALNNTRAIWHALTRTPWSFQRTPKYSRSAGGPPAGYQAAGSAHWWWTEVALGVYLCVALGYAASQAFFTVVPFLLPLSAGFLYSGLSSLVPAESMPESEHASSMSSPVESIVT